MAPLSLHRHVVRGDYLESDNVINYFFIIFKIIFISVFCYVPCKEGAEYHCHRLTSRFISVLVLCYFEHVIFKVEK